MMISKDKTGHAGVDQADDAADRVYDHLAQRYGPEDPRSSGYRSVGTFKFEAEEIRKVLRRYDGAILDVACGHGLVTSPLISEGRKVSGLDYNQIAAVSARRNGLDVVRGDAFDMPFKDNSFDVVLSAEFIQQYAPEQSCKLVRECVRVTRPGGVVVLVWRNGRSLLRQMITRTLRVIDGLRNRPPMKLYDHDFDTVVNWAGRDSKVEIVESLSLSPLLRLAIPGIASVPARLLGTSYLAVLRKVGSR